ncbi:MAG: hypothetical protein ACRD20_17320, partial [Terriglobales bacterium]
MTIISCGADPQILRQKERYTPDPFDIAQGRLFGTEVPQDDAGSECEARPSPSNASAPRRRHPELAKEMARSGSTLGSCWTVHARS